ncbi:MAG: FAD/NAD(P)-binding protein, partial [Kutzneria sp.]|nr:FAD/NAD(P)-binding protein [Kutzneria sp.]
MSKSQLEICIVGAGPRGLSVLERLCANERHSPSHPQITVHVVDPEAPGAGAVWRPQQSRHLLMNTVASQITVYTDDSVRIDGPIEQGPSLYEWAKGLLEPGGRGDTDDVTLAEARDLGPNTYPSRAFYGSYLSASFLRVVANAPEHVMVLVHRSRVVAMADVHGIPAGPQGVRLGDGTRLNQLDAIVLAQGHVPARLTAREERTAALSRIHHLTYITPANPADLDLADIKPGENVLIRGLGLNFFDHMALMTVGRGGHFVRAGGRLMYQASGFEPKLFASSRRGVPYHARGENEKGAYGHYYPKLLTAEYIQVLRKRAGTEDPVQFSLDLWPLISREVESVYYHTLLNQQGRPADAEELCDRYLTADSGTDCGPLLDEYQIPTHARWSWDKLSRPYGDRQFADRTEFRAWLLDYLAQDVKAARLGNLS